MVIRSIYAKNDEFFTFNDDLQTKDVVVFVPLFGEHWKIDCVFNQDAYPASAMKIDQWERRKADQEIDAAFGTIFVTSKCFQRSKQKLYFSFLFYKAG